MKIRGDRECQACGTQWSYFETGSVECPACGSLKSVGTDDRKRHTETPVELDLTTVRARVDAEPLRDVADAAAETCRSYVRKRGFIDGGELLALDETYLAATELATVAAELSRTMQPSDDEEFYFLTLLRGADEGDRPDPEAVPESLRATRGLAATGAVEAYVADLRTYLEDDAEPPVREPLGTLRDHRKRIEALDGDVPVAASERLLRAAEAIGRYLREDDESALLQAEESLDGLDRLGDW
ncbi:MAG: TFIIB-type zinc ribbon-containing protein [Haloarculaceae archaeon]